MRFSSLSPAPPLERGGSAIRWDALRRHGLTEGQMAFAQHKSSEIVGDVGRTAPEATGLGNLRWHLCAVVGRACGSMGE
jgi:hypothetical protein